MCSRHYGKAFALPVSFRFYPTCQERTLSFRKWLQVRWHAVVPHCDHSGQTQIPTVYQISKLLLQTAFICSLSMESSILISKSCFKKRSRSSLSHFAQKPAQTHPNSTHFSFTVVIVAAVDGRLSESGSLQSWQHCLIVIPTVIPQWRLF